MISDVTLLGPRAQNEPKKTVLGFAEVVALAAVVALQEISSCRGAGQAHSNRGSKRTLVHQDLETAFACKTCDTIFCPPRANLFWLENNHREKAVACERLRCTITARSEDNEGSQKKC